MCFQSHLGPADYLYYFRLLLIIKRSFTMIWNELFPYILYTLKLLKHTIS